MGRGYRDGHNIDFLKNRVAFDLEWNSKDQTFDRDLLAMRTYYDCGLVSVGIIITRAEELNEIFKTVYDYDGRTREWKPIIRKYGASRCLPVFLFRAYLLGDKQAPLGWENCATGWIPAEMADVPFWQWA